MQSLHGMKGMTKPEEHWITLAPLWLPNISVGNTHTTNGIKSLWKASWERAKFDKRNPTTGKMSMWHFVDSFLPMAQWFLCVHILEYFWLLGHWPDFLTSPKELIVDDGKVLFAAFFVWNDGKHEEWKAFSHAQNTTVIIRIMTQRSFKFL